MEATSMSKGHNAQSTQPGRNEEHATMTDIKSDFRDVGKDLTKLKDHAIGATSEAASEALGSVKNMGSEMCTWAKAHPMTSLLIAVGIGALASRFLFRP